MRSLANLAEKRITAETVEAWEGDTESPSYSVLERLAYEVYKRPIAMFFFPSPPAEETPRQSFRTLPESEIESLSARILMLVRQAMAMQANLEELNDGVNPAKRPVIGSVRFDPATPTSELALRVREALEVDLQMQFDWKNAKAAFEGWREAFEIHGISVFKDALKDDAVSRFCLFDESFPIIYVNNSRPFTHQIFTLFHELAHLLSGTGGIDAVNDSYIRALHGRNRQVEVFCNAFASRFLVPDTDFDRRIAHFREDDQSIAALADQYCVSREVILRRLRDKHLVTSEYYETKVSEWRAATPAKTGKGGNYYFTKGSYLGERYLELVFSRLSQNRITADQAAGYLGVHTRNVARMEALLFQKGVAA